MLKSSLLNSPAPMLMSTRSINSNNSNQNPKLRMVNPDTEPVIEIDADARKITIPKELKNIGVTGDCAAETVYFNCPRFFDGEDFSNHKCIIRYINAGNYYKESPVVDMTIGDDTLHFGWKIDNNVTQYSGEVNFTVQFETKVNSVVEYQWQTTPATFTVMAGLNIEATNTAKDNTLFTSLSNQMQELQRQQDVLTQSVEVLDLTDVVYIVDESEDK